jgi:lysozyme family protein
MTFEQAVAFVLKQEGGISDLASDPGGLTKFGISKRNHPDLDIANLTKEQAIEIYRRDYWHKLSCDQLPNGLDLLVFDAAANEGPAHAAQMLQSVLRINEDGVIGPLTIELARKVPGVVAEYLGHRMYHYAFSPQASTFGRGWFSRLARAAQLAFAGSR